MDYSIDARIDQLWMVRASAIQTPTTAHHNLLPLTKLLSRLIASYSLEIGAMAWDADYPSMPLTPLLTGHFKLVIVTKLCFRY
jgi:hypothetical protein